MRFLQWNWIAHLFGNRVKSVYAGLMSSTMWVSINTLITSSVESKETACRGSHPKRVRKAKCRSRTAFNAKYIDSRIPFSPNQE